MTSSYAARCEQIISNRGRTSTLRTSGFPRGSSRRRNCHLKKYVGQSGVAVMVAVMLGDSVGAPLKNGIEDMEVHGAIEGILRAAAGERPGADQNSELGDAEGVTATTSSRKRSAVWMHYQKVDDERKALCLLCKEKIQHQSSTSNLLRHLQKKHPSHFSKLETRPLKRTGGRRTCCMNTPQASTDLMVNVHTDKHQSNDTGTPSSAVSSPNHQLNTEQLVQSPNHSSDSCSVSVMLGDSERAPLENEIEDMEEHGAIEGILCAATGERPGSDQNSELGDADGASAATPSRKCSAVWMHYQKVDDERKALCLLCKKTIHYQSSTSNLLRHLQKKHPSHFSQLETRPLKRTGGRRTCCMNTPQASTDLMVNVHTDKHQSNDTGTPSSAVSSPNHQLNTEQLVQSPNYISDSCPGWSEGRVLQRDRELTEALRRVQREERLCLEQQRQLLEKSRELQAESHALYTERYTLQEEAKLLHKEKEEMQEERAKLQNERKEVERLKQELKEEQAMWSQRQKAQLECGDL
ncbi:zinc finger BED domain-containing protein isoform X3 [Clupea harengus]|uniref:Zinc finger BED domain-containing protein isoform X3 n=1 Tax=Clupea harengus TaxID=7950 RepID=A0A6P8FI73_CLUHA|nr:zinc finger BED domain-containing protein isoform X3 [Clupea harengus]